MAGFRFKIAELERETKTLKTMGKRFIDSQTSWTLDLFSSNLQSIRGNVEKTLALWSFKDFALRQAINTRLVAGEVVKRYTRLFLVFGKYDHWETAQPQGEK